MHAHIVGARADGGALGGHLLGGSVEPTLEVTLVEAPATLQRKTDPSTEGRPSIAAIKFARKI